MTVSRISGRRTASNALKAELTRKLRAFIYARVSKDPRHRETSIRDQMTDNHRTCEDNGWTVAGVFKDPDRSASRHAKRNRPEWEEMLRRATAGECDVIVFWESARAYRSLDVFVELRRLCVDRGILLCYDGDVFDISKPIDWKRLTRDALDAEEEAEKIRNRVLRTTRLSAERGAIHGKIPYGFRRMYDSATGDLLGQVEEAESAEVVREAAKRIAAGQTTYRIAKDLRERGVPAPRNGPRGWDPQVVKQVVLNPAVIGKRVHDKKIVGDAVWDPILDELTYNKCKRILTNPARRTQRDSAIKHLLSGIAIGPCGGVLRMRRNRGQQCYTCVIDFCASMEITKLDLYVEAAFLQYVSRPEFVATLQPSSSEDEMIREAVALAEELQAELEEARALVGKRQLSVASLAIVEQELLPQIEEAQQRMQPAFVHPVLSELAGPSAREVWAELDLNQKRAALRALGTIRLNRARVRGLRTIEPGRIQMPWEL